MKILDRYILKRFLISFLYCLAVFASLYIIADVFGHLDEILREHIKLKILIDYYLCTLPLILVQTTPFATLLAAIYILIHLNKNYELIAMRTGGLSVWRILLPFICTAAVISVLIFALNEKVVSSAALKAQNIKENYFKKNEKKPARDLRNVTLIGKENRLYYIKRFDPERNILWGITIFQQDKDQNLKSKIIAKLGKWTGKQWKFYNCIIYNVDTSGKIEGVPFIFKERLINLPEKPADFLKKRMAEEFMNISELKENLTQFGAGNETLTRRFKVNLYYRTALPFISLVILLTGFPFAIKLRGNGIWLGLGLSIFIGLIFYGVLAISIALGKSGLLPPFISAWGPSLLFIGVGVVMIGKRGN